jgi:hypothetical protein
MLNVKKFFKHDLKINFGTFTNKNHLLSQKTTLSLLVAEKFLEKIHNEMQSTDTNRVEFEIASEGFLYFIIGAKDALLQEINQKLKLGLESKDITLSKIKHRLQNIQTNNGNVWICYCLLDECTQEPIIYPNLDRTRSWLWEINHIRNQIAHRSIVSKHINVMVGAGSGNNVSMSITDNIKESDPYDYFYSNYNKFLKLYEEIKKLFKDHI